VAAGQQDVAECESSYGGLDRIQWPYLGWRWTWGVRVSSRVALVVGCAFSAAGGRARVAKGGCTRCLSQCKLGPNLVHGWVGPCKLVGMGRPARARHTSPSVWSDSFRRSRTKCVGPLEMRLEHRSISSTEPKTGKRSTCTAFWLGECACTGAPISSLNLQIYMFCSQMHK
jgi:hypothetical protein